MSQNLAAVVFDMDDVLCDYQFEVRLRGLAALSGLSADEVETRIWTSGFDEDGDRGKYDADQYLTEFNRRLDTNMTAAQWMAVRKESTVPNKEVLDLARMVAGSHPVALLTNNGPLFKRGMAEIFPELLEIFGQHAYCAYEFGAAKPDPTVFLGVAGALNVDPKAMCFVDDTEEYIQGARSVGVHAHHFKDADTLRIELERLQLI